MALFLLKRKRFVISILFLFTLMTLSIINSVYHDGEIKQIRFNTDERGNLLNAPPYPPGTVFLLGSDKEGFSLLGIMIEGAKYTIGFTILITIIRMLISLVLSAFTYSLNLRVYNLLKMIFEPFSIVPQTIIAFFILYSVLWMTPNGFTHPFWQRSLFESLILVIIAIPNLTIHLSNEMRLVEKESFIEVSKTLGASKPFIFFKHVIPHVYEKWILLFGQQFIQVLQLLAHLGFMKLFFGGTAVDYGSGSPPHTISYEWSGIIGDSIGYLYVHQWIILVPIAFFILTALSMGFINDSIKTFFQMSDRIRYERKD